MAIHVELAPQGAHITAAGITASLFAAYTILYGGYSKVDKSYDIVRRMQVLLSPPKWASKPIAQSKETNKILAQTASAMVSVATTVATISSLQKLDEISAAAPLAEIAWALSQQAVVVAALHVAASDIILVFRDTKKYLFGEKAKPIFAGTLAFIAFVSLAIALQPSSSSSPLNVATQSANYCKWWIPLLALLSNWFAIDHVYNMSVRVVGPKKETKLDMRPMGLIGFGVHSAVTVLSIGMAVWSATR